MTKEQVLQKVNDYCGEKSYTSETLTDDFKEMFSDFFAKKYPSEKDIDEDGVVDDIKFNINTAFSAASKGLTAKQKAFDQMENTYKETIESLKKNTQNDDTEKDKTLELSKELKEKLDRLEVFETEQRKNNMFKEVLSLAKKEVRQDLHKSLENYADDFAVTLDESASEQAKKLTARFQEIFKDSIGDIKPLAPQQRRKRDEDMLASVQKVIID